MSAAASAPLQGLGLAGVLPAGAPPAAASIPGGGPSFATLLSQQTGSAATPRFSRHALDRLAQRGIELNAQTVERLRGGIDRAATKGSRDSVVFVDSTAFVGRSVPESVGGPLSAITLSVSPSPS